MKTSCIGFLILCAIALSGCGREPKLTTRSPEAVHDYAEGVGLSEKFYFREAISALQRSLAIDSTFAMAWMRLAVVHSWIKDEPEASATMARAVSYSQRVTQREQLLIRMWNYRLHYSIHEAVASADSLILLYPDETEAYVFRGNMYELNQKLDSAIQCYKKAIEIDTSYARAVMYLGYAYSAGGQQDEAISQMDRYIRLAPDAADPRASYGDLLLRVGRYDDALDQYRKSLELKPDFWYSVNQVGEVYSILGRLHEAEEQFHRGLNMLPQNRQLEAALLSRDATLNVRRGRPAEAIHQYEQALAIDTNAIEVAFGLVYALSKERRFGEAGQVAERIKQELDRKNLAQTQVMSGYYLMQARLLTEQGLLAVADSVCRAALEYASPLTRPPVFRQFAEIRLREKSFDAALDACEEALVINPNSPEGLLTLTRVYRAMGDKRLTQEIGGRLLALWKNADADFQNLLEVRRLVGLRR